jgi:predicted enzyme related to lactoylglutathione lyase
LSPAGGASRDGPAVEPNDNPLARTFQQGVYEQGLPVIVFGVDDIEKEVARLKERGVVFRSDPEPMGPAIVANFEDTCGNIVQLAQMAA